MATPEGYKELEEKLGDRWWRLNNLYYITDKKGNKIKFVPNEAQTYLYNNMHYFNVILKARQLGFTTFIMIFFLDACLFNSNHNAGIIAHTQVDANDLFENKIKFAYDNLPKQIKEQRPATADSARKLVFSNGSTIYTGVSLRSGTLQKLLVSEYGKVSAKAPEKAREIKTGAFNTVESGQMIFVESTAEGKSGEFYNLCETSRKATDSGKPLARLEPKFFFFAWWKNPKYIANDNEVKHTVITNDLRKYFIELEKTGVKLTDKQKSWYVIKSNQQGDDMTQEYPSTPEEAFQGSLKGAFYTEEMQKVRQNNQICYLPYNPKFEVYTWWDLGLNDLMTIWFYQYINGRHCFIDYHESSVQGWDYYGRLIKDKGYNYGGHFFPHDGGTRRRGVEVFTDAQLARDCGIRPIEIVPVTQSVYKDIINHCKPILPSCWFDAEKCAKGILHLDNHRKVFDKAEGCFIKKEYHGIASNAASGFRTFAVSYEEHIIVAYEDGEWYDDDENTDDRDQISGY